MNILIVGNGGREHAFAWKISQSPLCEKLYVAPGNAGTGMIAENVTISVDNFPELANFCIDKKIGLMLVGPEAPLVKGIRNYFQSIIELKDLLIVGPDQTGAQLEGSKDFSKQFMLRHNVPTAKARTFNAHEVDQAFSYIENLKPPIVLKADGLAAGKGVIISPTQDEAKEAIRDMLVNKRFGDASAKVLIEEFLDGIELSVFVLTDGKDYVILPEAKDYKRIGDGDTGPNTGGMGAVSPVVFADAAFMHKVEEKVVKPTIAGLHAEKINYCGFIFIGLMNIGGEPYVIEYNARMGDPETEAVMTRINNDFVELLIAAAEGKLKAKKIDVDPAYAVTLVLVSGGYPGDYVKGKVITGLSNDTKALVFHAGTRAHNDTVVTEGGRVLAITGKGTTMQDARDKAYETAKGIGWEGLYYRKDIAEDLIKYKD